MEFVGKPIQCKAAVAWAPNEPLRTELITVDPPKVSKHENESAEIDGNIILFLISVGVVVWCNVGWRSSSEDRGQCSLPYGCLHVSTTL